MKRCTLLAILFASSFSAQAQLAVIDPANIAENIRQLVQLELAKSNFMGFVWHKAYSEGKRKITNIFYYSVNNDGRKNSLTSNGLLSMVNSERLPQICSQLQSQPEVAISKKGSIFSIFAICCPLRIKPGFENK